MKLTNKRFKKKIHYVIFTCFVFFLCCSFAFEAERGNIKLILALP